MGDRITTEEQTATNYVSSVVQKLVGSATDMGF
jgi:hypothetical protein